MGRVMGSAMAFGSRLGPTVWSICRIALRIELVTEIRARPHNDAD
jgi:hypothetical protein